MNPELIPALEQLVADHNGMVRLDGERSSFVVMSDQAYREMLGIGTDEELRESLAAIEQGVADMENGRTRPFIEVLDEIRRGNGSPH
jgi:predicted transcriptional regulator